MSRPVVGILKPGSTFPAMIERFGDYDAWFARAIEPAGATCVTYDVRDGSPPAPEAADGWIVTGARSSVIDRDPAVERLLAWLREVVAAEAPLLGVCYGHQALCAALGGPVARNPRGWEIGTAEVTLTAAGREDPLFRGFPERFLVQTTHEDLVTEVPPGAMLLATNEHAPVQAVAAGPAARGVQFHPEVTTAISRDFVASREHLLETVPPVSDAPWGARVLANFVEAFVRGRAPARADGE